MTCIVYSLLQSKHPLKEGFAVILSWYFSHSYTLERLMSSDYLLCQPQDGTLAQP